MAKIILVMCLFLLFILRFRTCIGFTMDAKSSEEISERFGER